MADTAQIARDEQLTVLLQACADGDHAALAALYELTSSQLYGVLRRILDRKAIADEALQETYTKIWTRAAQFNAERASPIVWMNRIARNQAIDLIRQRSIREDHELSDPESELSRGVSLTDIEGSTLDGDLLDFCLQQLQQTPRECVVAAYCEGFSHDELSEKFNKPLGTVKSWIRRSLLALKKCIDENS